MKHLVTITLLVDVENESGIGEVEDAFMEDLAEFIEDQSRTFHATIENPEWDEMAMDTAPSEEEAADGYYEADGDQTETEIEESFEYAISEIRVEKIQDVPYGMAQYSIQGYQRAIARRDASMTSAAAHVATTTPAIGGAL